MTFTAGSNITSVVSAVQIRADVGANSNVQLFSIGYDGFDTRAQAISSANITNNVSGTIDITEYQRYLDYDSTTFSNSVVIASTANMYSVAAEINNMGFANVSAAVIEYQGDSGSETLLQIRGYDFEINNMPVDTNISTGRYSSELFAVSSTNTTLNTIRVRDDLFASSNLVASMSNVTLELVVPPGSEGKIPFDYANVFAGTALSLADRANADPRNSGSIMKFIHGLPTPVDNPPGFDPD